MLRGFLRMGPCLFLYIVIHQPFYVTSVQIYTMKLEA